MAKKIYACAKDESGEFVLNDKGRLRYYFIWQVLRMKYASPKEYHQLTFFSTHNAPDKRAVMTPVKSGFFRYNRATNGGGNTGGENESITHQMAIAVLTQMNEVKLRIQQQDVIFKFDIMETEDTHLRLSEGQSYYPDILCTFHANNPLYARWEGKVAIEVAVHHYCESQKIIDLEKHGVPVIEIGIGKKWWFPADRIKGRNYDESDVEKYYGFLMERFSEKALFATIVSNPISSKYHAAEIKRLKAECDADKQSAAEAHQQELSELSQKASKIIDAYRNIKEERDDLVAQLAQLKKEKSTLLKPINDTPALPVQASPIYNSANANAFDDSIDAQTKLSSHQNFFKSPIDNFLSFLSRHHPLVPMIGCTASIGFACVSFLEIYEIYPASAPYDLFWQALSFADKFHLVSVPAFLLAAIGCGVLARTSR